MISAIELTKEQISVKEALIDYINNPHKKFLTLGGYAGCGKTTVIASLANELSNKRIAYCAYTGKASSILRSKLDYLIKEYDYVGTIHGLIYKRVEEINLNNNKKPKRHLKFYRKKSYELDYDLIIVDEASMINEELFKDLLYYGIPVIFVGDHGQLPPIHGSFNLMNERELDLRLETIHRQVADHPIIKASIMARKDGFIPFGRLGEGVSKVQGSVVLNNMDLSSRLVLCGKNSTRITMNKAIRGNTSNIPIIGDKVICLRNSHEEGLYNGMIGKVLNINKLDASDRVDYDSLYAEIEFDNTIFEGEIHIPQFNQLKTISQYNKDMGKLFDFGYCITVHKAQGSEADSVILIEEQFGPPNRELYSKWLYTAVTRAKKELLIIA